MKNKTRILYLIIVGVFLISSIFASNQINPPSAPGRPEVTDIYSNSCNITYKAPLSDGGSPVTGYLVEQRDTKTNKWEIVDVVKSLTCYATRLIEGNEYVFRVCAENIVGFGPHSGISNPIIAREPFDK